MVASIIGKASCSVSKALSLSLAGLVYMKPEEPYETEMIISDYHGRQFNSVNDVVIHKDGSIWFTDPAYGHEQGIRPLPQLPPQTYRYDPGTG